MIGRKGNTTENLFMQGKKNMKSLKKKKSWTGMVPIEKRKMKRKKKLQRQMIAIKIKCEEEGILSSKQH